MSLHCKFILYLIVLRVFIWKKIHKISLELYIEMLQIHDFELGYKFSQRKINI